MMSLNKTETPIFYLLVSSGYLLDFIEISLPERNTLDNRLRVSLKPNK